MAGTEATPGSARPSSGPAASDAREPSPIDAQLPTSQPGTDYDVPGLAGFLAECDLQGREGDIKEWCRLSGAAFLDEVKEHAVELASDVGLTDEESARLLRRVEESRRSAVHPTPQCAEATIGSQRSQTWMTPQQTPTPAVQAPLAKLRSVPITLVEVQSASARAAQAYIPLQAWGRVGAGARRTLLKAPSLIRSQSVDPQEIGCGPEGDVLSRRQIVRQSGNFYRMRDWTPPRFRVTRAKDLAAIRARIPSPEEIRAVSDAQARLREQTADAQIPLSARSQRRDDDAPKDIKTFSDLQDYFIAEHSTAIRSEMPGVVLRKAEVGPEVQERFMNTVQSLTDPAKAVQPTYHGTYAANFASIQSRGLIVPGHGGVTVAHGSLNGVGIYTARLGAAGLSQGFCDSDKMFVCAVANLGKVAAKDARPDGQKWFGSKDPGGQRFHRNHQKAQTDSTLPPSQATHPVQKHRDAVVVFQERCVAPVLVAENTRGTPETAGGNPQPHARGAQPGGGYQVGRQQVQVGDQRFWAPPEEDRWHKGMHLRRAWEEKSRDTQRRAARDAKYGD